MRACRDCSAYKDLSTRPIDKQQGQCRYMPPSIIMTVTHTYTWPIVDADDWCLKFRRKHDCNV